MDDYISGFPPGPRRLLEEMRATIRAAAPGATERISYQMPAFDLNGILVWYAGFSGHVGLYPKGSAVQAFKEELKPYKTSKGTIQFPLDQPLPTDLVRRIVEFRVTENQAGRHLRG